VEQVQKCSLNLVDVIDHLLDFAQINNKASARRPSDSRSDHKVGILPPRSKTSSCVSLGRTTEAIVDAVFYSHYFTKHDRTQPHVDFVMELTPRSATQCMISVGAWKRLCTNIVNNALKYTPAGHVKVSLDVSERGTGEVFATLIVSDTGIGMSPEFLRESLFKSFAQEDTFANGTGLGMSLVAELIKEFCGEIEVTSEKGVGTTMTVTIPLDVPKDATSTGIGSDFDHSGVCVAYFEPDEDQEDTDCSRQALIDAAKQTLRNMGVAVGPSNDANIVAILEEHFVHSTDDTRYLVLCDSFASATRLRERYQGARAEFVPQPYGPERLSTALQTLCKSLSEQTETGAGSDLPSPGAIDKYSASLRLQRNRAMSALPSPPIDVTLDYLTLSSPSANTVKGAARDNTVGFEHRERRPTFGSSGMDTASLSQKILSSPHDDRPSTAEPAQPLDPLLLLLVDDNVSTVIEVDRTLLTIYQPINLKLLTMVADRNHYPRLLATNGQEAVDAYKSPQEATEPTQHQNHAGLHAGNRRPDVVLLDLNMPVMNGFEAARQIRQFEKQTGASPAVIIAITGLGDDIARARAYQHGFNFFMSKPVRPKDVIDMLVSIEQTKIQNS
jgi:CheY-like chemotaxis protein/anti-sigma regulatory factor (Ser/Thr protein kinase)